MTRAHLYRPVTDAAGNIRQNALVRVLNPGTTTPISEPLYTSDAGDSTRPNPGIFNNGVIDFYLAAPRRVRIGVRFGQGQEFFFEDVDVPLTGSFRAQDISIEASETFTSTNVQGALYDLASGIAQLGEDALRLPRSEGTALYTPDEPLYLTNGELVPLNFMESAPEPVIEGEDLRWEDLTGSWVVNTTGYYSFSIDIILTNFTSSTSLGACAEARLNCPRVPAAPMSAVLAPGRTIIRMGATLQTALYEEGDNVDLRGFRAFFASGSPRVGSVTFKATRVGLVEGVGTPGDAEIEAIVWPGEDTFPSPTLYPRTFVALS